MYIIYTGTNKKTNLAFDGIQLIHLASNIYKKCTLYTSKCWFSECYSTLFTLRCFSLGNRYSVQSMLAGRCVATSRRHCLSADGSYAINSMGSLGNICVVVWTPLVAAVSKQLLKWVLVYVTRQDKWGTGCEHNANNFRKDWHVIWNPARVCLLSIISCFCFLVKFPSLFSTDFLSNYPNISKNPLPANWDVGHLGRCRVLNYYCICAVLHADPWHSSHQTIYSSCGWKEQ